MRKRSLVLVFLSFVITINIYGQYPVMLISPELLKNANVVKRFDETQFILKNPGEAICKRKYVYTILNEKGDPYAQFNASYDKFNEIRSIEGVLYDAFGKTIKKLKSKDLQDLSGTDDGSLMDDNRYKSHNFYYKVYPYTIEYELETKYNGTMFYPPWVPQRFSLMSVQESNYSFTCPDTYDFRYKAYQYAKDPTITAGKGTKTYSWKIDNLPAIVREPYAPSLGKIAPVVLMGPSHFEMENYKGNMKSWQDLGKFIYALIQGRDVLPDDVKKTVHHLTDNVKEPLQKINILYDYLQKNSRYISIQLGIGGWQPFDAKFVATKRYGDCKALTNYMLSLLKEAGITSYYSVVLAGSGEDDISTDFPSSQFNHVILCVPRGKDTTWLECTSQTVAPGYMGKFTGNRHALLIAEDGGKLVRTPTYGLKENTEVRKIKASLEENGTLNLKVHTLYASMQQDDIHGLINALSRDKVKEFLHRRLDFATYEIKDFKYSEQKSSKPIVDESLDIVVSNYATITGKRLFILPNIMTRDGKRLTVDENRKYDIELGMEYKDIDTVEIQIPSGYEPEAVPKDVTIESKFGKYSSSIKLKDGKIYYYRSMEQFSGIFPAKDYAGFAQHLEAVYKADRNRIVFARNEKPALKAF